MSDTVLDRLVTALTGALGYNKDALAAPVALLWPDRDAEWGSVVERLRGRLPVISLGDYDRETCTGPAFWLRCVVAETMPARDESSSPPVVYLSGVGREDLRAIEDCPPHLAPIAELQYRGQWFSDPAGRDWSLLEFLRDAKFGLGLQVAKDADTTDALAGAMDTLLETPISQLADRYLTAEDFNDLVSPHPERLVLEWLDEPAALRSRLSDGNWTAFRQQCKSKLDFDVAQGEVEGARLLGEGLGPWKHVWSRFREAPTRYPGVPQRLRNARPDQLFTEQVGVWPQDNETAEIGLREDLAKLADVSRAEAARRVAELEATHAARRESVWAELGEAPLAFSLEHLVRLAVRSAQTLSGTSVDGIAEAYASHGWEVDDALVEALREAPNAADRKAVGAAANTLYRDWAHTGATAFQASVGPLANSGTYKATTQLVLEPGDVAVFVDGLRFDVGRHIEKRLLGAGCVVELSASLAALPTVTPTAKPALVPVDRQALGPGPGLSAGRAANGTAATVSVLRSLMSEQDVQILAADDVGDVSGMAWTEAGEIDHRGHDQGVALVDVLGAEIELVARRVLQLLDAGWTRVHIATDHGWLLMPSALEKQALLAAATEMKKGRCARLKPAAEVAVLTVPWHWDHDVRIALAPGVTCFEAGKTYEHGGVSPQECVVPRAIVRRVTQATSTSGAQIVSFKWLGLMCRIEFAGAPPGSLVDIRGIAGDPKTSVAAAAKETSGEGRMPLMVGDEDLTGQPASIVLVSTDGDVLAQREVTIGVNR